MFRYSVCWAGIFLAYSAVAQTNSAAITLSFDTVLNGNVFTGSGSLEPYGSASIALNLNSRAILFTLADGPASATGPFITPAALTFVAPSSGNPATQSIQFVNLSNQTLAVIATPQFQTTAGWFTATSLSNSVAAGGTLTETIAVNTKGLAPGPYAGSLDLRIPQLNANYYAGVILVVAPASAATPASATTTCTPTQLLPVFTNLERFEARGLGPG